MLSKIRYSAVFPNHTLKTMCNYVEQELQLSWLSHHPPDSASTESSVRIRKGQEYGAFWKMKDPLGSKSIYSKSLASPIWMRELGHRQETQQLCHQLLKNHARNRVDRQSKQQYRLQNSWSRLAYTHTSPAP